MSSFDQFAVGDRVKHISLGFGTVESLGEFVTVKFDRSTTAGDHVVGRYDRNWFKHLPLNMIALGPQRGRPS